MRGEHSRNRVQIFTIIEDKFQNQQDVLYEISRSRGGALPHPPPVPHPWHVPVLGHPLTYDSFTSPYRLFMERTSQMSIAAENPPLPRWYSKKMFRISLLWLHWTRPVVINPWDSLSLRVLHLWTLKLCTNSCSFAMFSEKTLPRRGEHLCHVVSYINIGD